MSETKNPYICHRMKEKSSFQVSGKVLCKLAAFCLDGVANNTSTSLNGTFFVKIQLSRGMYEQQNR